MQPKLTEMQENFNLPSPLIALLLSVFAKYAYLLEVFSIS